MGFRMRRTLLLTAGLSLVVYIAFLDVQMHYYTNSVLLDKREANTWNASARHRTLMQRLVKREKLTRSLDYIHFNDLESERPMSETSGW